MQDQGHLIVIDALDGAGKSTAIKAMADWLRAQGLRVFDLPAYLKEHHEFPEIDEPELAQADVLLSAEPTYCWVGNAIRQELIKTHPNRSYSGKIVANTYALDRQILFSRVVLPFLQARPDRWVVQDRGAITSLAYQPLQDPQVTLPWLLELEGNKLELSRPPDLLMILDIKADQAAERLSGREDKNDQALFEKREFQQRLEARYHDPDVLAPYRTQGTNILYIDASQPAELVAQQACAVLQTLMP